MSPHDPSARWDTRHRRPTYMVVAGLALCGLLSIAGGCGGNSSNETSPSTSNSGTQPEDGPTTTNVVYERELRPSACVDPTTVVDRIDCLTLTIPEDRTDPTGRQVELPVLRILGGATSQTPPAVYLHGGPGAGAVAGWAAWLTLADRLGRDLIVYDQRGGGSANPRLDCPEHAKALSTILSEHPPWPDAQSQVGEALESCHARLLSDGVALDHYNTAESVRDLEDLRVALDAEKLSLVGSSYGTTLALSYQRVHPDRVASMALGGVDPPDGGTDDGDGALLDSAVSRLVDACDAEEPCATKYPNLRLAIEQAAADFDDRPAEIEATNRAPSTIDGQPGGAQSPNDSSLDSTPPAPRTIKVTGDELYAGLFAAMYDTSAIRLLPSVISGFASGDRSLLDALGPILTQAGVDGTAVGAQMSVTCGDLGPRTSSSAEQSTTDPGRARDITLTSPAGFCSHWPVARSKVEATTNDEGAKTPVPTLIISGDLDPITPANVARSLATDIGATLIEIPDAGHDVMFVNPCARANLRAFIADPHAVVKGCDEEPATHFE